MAIVCKNCGRVFDGNFCYSCGQPADTHQLNVHFIWHDIQHGLFHFDEGIYFSVKELYTRPGHSIREFISGKRIKHFRPISLVIVLATVYGLLYHSFEIDVFTSGETQAVKIEADINQWISGHYYWLTLATIPLYTLGTYICFKSQGYNYIEYFVLNAFKAAQRLILHLATFPVLYYFNGTPTIKTVTTILYILDIVLIYWTNIQFFDRLRTVKVMLLSALSHVIFLICVCIILVLILLLFGHLN